jgi:hypothetical protein
LSKPKTSKPESSATKQLPLPSFDKLYWLRAGFAALGGVLSAVLVGSNYLDGVSLGILMYLLSYYVPLFTWYKGQPREVQGKVYTTGIGTFVMVFLFTWILIFTVQSPAYLQ